MISRISEFEPEMDAATSTALGAPQLRATDHPVAESPVNVLIVDDVPVNLKLLRAVLEVAGYKVTEAKDGVEALAALEAHGADAIVSDIFMPNMDGYRLCLEVRQSERFHQVPFIAYTAKYVCEADEQFALDLGADFYIRKPSPAKVMLDSLRMAIARRGRKNPPIDAAKGHEERVAARLQQLRRDLATRKKIARLNGKLERKNRQLNEVDRFKSEFLATASHEMRTPLAIIREFASIMADGISGPVSEPQSRCLTSILRNCDRLTQLIGDLLDLAKIEAGRIQLERRSLDIASLLSETVFDFDLKAKAKSQNLVLDLGSDPLPPVLADRSKIQQVLVNLIGNAQKFSNDGGRIVVGAGVCEGGVHVHVTDNGVGIDGLQLESVFEAFTQIDRTEGPGTKGTGLGLTITRKIVRIHDADIHVVSEKGHGASFAFSLPIYTPEAEQVAFLVDQTRSLKDGSMLQLVAIAFEHIDGPCQPAVMQQTMAACDRAMPDGNACVADIENCTLLFALKSHEPLDKSQVAQLLSDVPHLDIDVSAITTELDHTHAARILKRIRTRLAHPIMDESRCA